MPDEPTQFEQENDLGRGGGEVDDDTMADAWRASDERLRRETDVEEQQEKAAGEGV